MDCYLSRTLCACASEYGFDLGLTANTNYYAKVTDVKFGTEYWLMVTTDDAGEFTIQADDSVFPDDFFNPYVGNLTLSVYTSPDKDIVTFTVDEHVYEAINIEMVSCEGYYAPNVLSL